MKPLITLELEEYERIKRFMDIFQTEYKVREYIQIVEDIAEMEVGDELLITTEDCEIQVFKK